MLCCWISMVTGLQWTADAYKIYSLYYSIRDGGSSYPMYASVFTDRGRSISFSLISALAAQCPYGHCGPITGCNCEQGRRGPHDKSGPRVRSRHDMIAILMRSLHGSRCTLTHYPMSVVNASSVSWWRRKHLRTMIALRATIWNC